MAKDKVFLNGLYINPPPQGIDWIICKIGINVDQLLQTLQNNNDERINLDVKRSDEGKYYAEVNTWKPDLNNNNNNNNNNDNNYNNNNNDNYNNQGGNYNNRNNYGRR